MLWCRRTSSAKSTGRIVSAAKLTTHRIYTKGAAWRTQNWSYDQGMVYNSRPETGDARLAWDRFTLLHEAEPVEMELLDNEHKWRFRYPAARGSNDVTLSVSG